MHRAGQGIQVRHQVIPEFHVGEDALIGLGALRSDVPEFAAGILSMGAEQRHEGAELVPAGLEFLPLVSIRRIVELVHHGETADVHAPHGKARHRIVQAGRHLHAHVVPGRADVAAPGGCGIALEAGETVPGQEEHPLVGIHRPLAVVDGVGIHEGIGVQILRGRSQGCRSQEPLEVVHGQAVAEVRFARVHPPGVDLLAVAAVQGLVHLAPEHLPAALRIGVVEGLSMAQPVHDGRVLGMGVGVTRSLEFLVMFRIGVELGPHADHEPAVHRVHVVQHLLRVGETGLVELVTSPLVLLPVHPVLDDVVHRNAPAAHLGEGADEFILRGIALAALPEAQGPLRVQGGLAREGAVAADHFVIGFSRHEVEVHLRLELGPETQT